MSFFRRLLRGLKPKTGAFEVDADLIESLQELAEHEQRPEQELAAELLSSALAQRQAEQEMRRRWDSLTPREQQVAALSCQGFTYRQIAARLHISPETVKTHISNALHKFGVGTSLELRQLLAHWDFSDWH